MNELALVLFYSAIVVASALLGGWIPLVAGTNQRRLEYFLAASAGVLLGIVGMHLLPESFGVAGPNAAWGVLGGFLFLLVIERFVLPHPLHSIQAAAEPAGDVETATIGEASGEGAVSPSEAVSVKETPEAFQQRIRSEAAGFGAYLGLSLHTVTDGVALGAAMEDRRVAFYVLLAIVLHKIPSAFALGSLLVKARTRPVLVLAATGSLGLLVAVGAIGFRLATYFAGFDAFAITPYAVAFSAGSFLHVAVTDLLPDLHRSGVAKTYLLLALFGGLGISLLLGGIVPEP